MVTENQKNKLYLNKIKLIIIALCITSVMFGCENILSNDNDIAYDSSPEEPIVSAAPIAMAIPDNDVVTADSLLYLGAFRLPDDGANEEDMFSWGGEALAYNHVNHSLFIAGHSWHVNIAEISIPEVVISDEVCDLNKAEILQQFSDVKGSLFDSWSVEIPRVGLEVIGEKLYFCIGEHYEENTELGTHGFTGLQLTKAKKVCTVGDFLYSTNDYMFKIPSKWQSEFAGNDLFTGRFRDGGWSGMGPSLFAVSTEDILNAEHNGKIDALPILLYDNSYEGDNGRKMSGYSHADSITGGAFVECDARSSIVFTATHGFGDTWYGFSNGVVYPIDGDENTQYPDVPEYPYDERGWWNDKFGAALIMYEPSHLAKSACGELAANEVQPYAIINLNEYMMIERDETSMQYLGGCAYDSEGNRLYVLELFADEDKPIVHVFTFE